MSQYEWFIFSSIELFWELVSKFHIPYRLRYIKIDRFHALSIKHGQKWKKLYWLTFGSSEPIGEFISEIHLGQSWTIMIHSGSMANVSVFRVVCCTCSQRFTSGNIHTSLVSVTNLKIEKLTRIMCTKFQVSSSRTVTCSFRTDVTREDQNSETRIKLRSLPNRTC